MTTDALPEEDGRYTGRRVLVTGATGLIGSALVARLLEHGASVHTFVLPDSDPEPYSALVRSGRLADTVVHRGRLEEQATVERAVLDARPEIVFHLGAQSLVPVARSEPLRTLQANAAGTWCVLDACRRLVPAPASIVVASSDKAYGSSVRLPYRETDPIAGSHEPYEASKAITDIVARTYAATYGLPVRIARCGNVYGPGDWNWSRIVPGTIRSLLRDESPIVRSDGTPVRDYLHVDDVAAAYLALGTAEVSAGEAFNFSSGEHLSVLELIRLLQQATGRPHAPEIQATATHEIAAQWLDASKAGAILGWRPRRRIATALPDVVAWYREVLS